MEYTKNTVDNLFYKKHIILTSGSNADNLTDDAYYYIDGNTPTNVYGLNGVLLQFKSKNFLKLQLAFNWNTGKIAGRYCNFNSEWSSWKEIHQL